MRVSRDLADLAPAAALAALFFATGVLLPVFGQALGFLASTPLIWLAARHGIRAGLLASLLAASALLPLLPPPVTLIFAVEHALPAAGLGWALARGRGVARPSAIAATLITALMLGGAFLFATDVSRDPSRLLEEQLRTAFAELGGAAGGGETSTAPLTPAQFEEIFVLLRRVLPAVALVGIFIECAVNTLIAARFLARQVPGFAAPNLAAFALPEALVWAVIPALALSLAAQGTVATVALNTLIPLLCAYLLQGLSILLHLAERARISRLGRTLITIAFAIQPWLLALPLLLGLLDFRFGFRSRFPLAPKQI